MSASAKAIISYRVGKRVSDITQEFLFDLRERVIGSPEISADGFHPNRNAIRDAFDNRHARRYQQNLFRTSPCKEAQGRYPPL